MIAMMWRMASDVLTGRRAAILALFVGMIASPMVYKWNTNKPETPVEISEIWPTAIPRLNYEDSSKLRFGKFSSAELGEILWKQLAKRQSDCSKGPFLTIGFSSEEALECKGLLCKLRFETRHLMKSFLVDLPTSDRMHPGFDEIFIPVSGCPRKEDFKHQVVNWKEESVLRQCGLDWESSLKDPATAQGILRLCFTLRSFGVGGGSGESDTKSISLVDGAVCKIHFEIKRPLPKDHGGIQGKNRIQ